ncbi:hypothetical protein QIH96_05310 [Bradyrhizobium japonicum]|uniref:hypothetical protein n=1 Tax=Bradyrhizobium japonicum TaxID=375 RepID=UPI002714C46D|nr:hypothetical protein [Bradyrhizobium japonicum]WLB64664.1 hypothetical protein QIH96_05310 [Bradyrhizobium japonicum]
MTSADIKRIRNRALLYLSQEVASVAGLSLADFQQFALGKSYDISDQQLAALARRMGLKLQGAPQ